MKEKYKRIIMLVALGFLIFSVAGKLLTNIDDTPNNNDISNTIDKSNNSHNFSQVRGGINITTENYQQYYEAKGLCKNVISGNTIDVEGVGRVRLVGIVTPNKEGQPGFEDAKKFLEGKCLGKTVYLDIDDAENKDKYGRILAVVYVDGYNINGELLKRGYAQILFIPPSEFDPNQWL